MRPSGESADLLRETHLQQPVSFIQHQHLQVLQADRLRVADMIYQPALQYQPLPFQRIFVPKNGSGLTKELPLVNFSFKP